jgi:formylglycine-generating enzyme required for sulfatase activity
MFRRDVPDKLLIHKDELYDQLQRIWPSLNNPPAIDRFYRFLRERSVVMGPYGEAARHNGEGVVFNHKTFMEYLTALHLNDESKNRSDRIERIAGYITNGDWRIVLQFYMNEADKFIFREFMQTLFKRDLLKNVDIDLVLEFVRTSPERDKDIFADKLFDETGSFKNVVVECLDAFDSKEACDILYKFIAGEKKRDKVRELAEDRLVKSRFVNEFPDLMPAVRIDVTDKVRVDDSVREITARESFRNPHELNADYILIPGGTYIYQKGKKVEKEVIVPGLYFAKYPVTNQRYRRFINYLAGNEKELSKILKADVFAKLLTSFAKSPQADDKKYIEYLGKSQEWAGKLRSGYDDDKQFNGDDHPVVGVSWYAARAYCLWISCLELAEKTGSDKIELPKAANLYKLPVETEWEWAAGGGQRTYPWGNKPEPNEKLANYGQNVGATTPVGRYPEGATPEGLMDMAGNVWEWCENLYGEGAFGKRARALRGGSWDGLDADLRCSARNYFDPDGWVRYVGFRLLLGARS